MQRNFAALSIVTPAGQSIVQGQKRLEIRSWQPEQLPLKDLVIVENKNYLNKAGDEEAGMAVAIVDIKAVLP